MTGQWNAAKSGALAMMDSAMISVFGAAYRSPDEGLTRQRSAAWSLGGSRHRLRALCRWGDPIAGPLVGHQQPAGRGYVRLHVRHPRRHRSLQRGDGERFHVQPPRLLYSYINRVPDYGVKPLPRFLRVPHVERATGEFRVTGLFGLRLSPPVAVCGTRLSRSRSVRPATFPWPARRPSRS